MAKPMKNHFLVQCGGGKKLTKKFSTAKTASEAAMRAVAAPKGPRICLVRPVKVQCMRGPSGKCTKKMLAKMDPVMSFARTARGVKSIRGTF